jgi:predicted HicB family RNase H-like nuclease
MGTDDKYSPELEAQDPFFNRETQAELRRIILETPREGYISFDPNTHYPLSTVHHTMQYKGYTAAIEYSDEDGCLVGRVLGTRHAIVFGGATVEETRAAFKDMMDDYPAMCHDLGVEPDSPPEGVLVPIAPELYAKVSRRAECDGITVGKAMETALESFVSGGA